ncbi:(2Fe-2S)-binding protein [Geomicrobium sp. JCM 19038]|uniref:(2Fe-2S)-binding protein n=1 Tax=Geomicrobium sp. JCM 19038 TaxID=1460635 RepID=UPI00045F3A02|nr:(2Fe-2S)-binding protein [Geomicrobium sp. JCM 19038]GAK07924.1 probable pyridine nucleotide-disulphide oxidoreductase [Geomicrobium sp. JCM 19038]
MADCVICRCEEVVLSDIVQALEDGYSTHREIKLKTRAGMGICQGRTCRPLLDQIITSISNEAMPKRVGLVQNVPIRPITLGDLAKGKVGDHES